MNYVSYCVALGKLDILRYLITAVVQPLLYYNISYKNFCKSDDLACFPFFLLFLLLVFNLFLFNGF